MFNREFLIADESQTIPDVLEWGFSERKKGHANTQGKKKPVRMDWNWSDWYKLMVSKISMYMLIIMYILHIYVHLYACISICVYKCIYFLVLSAEKVEKLGCSSSREHTLCPDLGLCYYSKGNQGSSEKWLIPGWGQGSYKINLEHCYARR